MPSEAKSLAEALSPRGGRTPRLVRRDTFEGPGRLFLADYAPLLEEHRYASQGTERQEYRSKCLGVRDSRNFCWLSE